MVINNVRIFLNPTADESALKATATMLVNNELLLQGIRIRGSQAKDDPDGPIQLRVVYPTQALSNGHYRRCFYPSTAESFERYNSAILEAYERVLAGEDNTVVFDDSDVRPEYAVTQHSVFPGSEGKFYKAKASIELDGELWLRGMYLVRRDDESLFLLMPRCKTKDDRRIDYFHPLDQTARNKLTSGVISAYEQTMAEIDE